jgi:hypothetical protein
VVLEQGAPGWHKLQSAFAAARAMGSDVSTAYGLQAVLSLTVLSVLASAARKQADSRLVAALAAVATLLATPYAFDYDMMVLGVAIAFAAAHGGANVFAAWEKTALAIAWIAPLVARPVMESVHVPVGLLAMLALFMVLARRALDPVKERAQSAIPAP